MDHQTKDIAIIEISPEDKEAARLAQEQAQRLSEFTSQVRSLFHTLSQFLLDASNNDMDVKNLNSAVQMYKAVISKQPDRRADFEELYRTHVDDWASLVKNSDWLTDEDVLIKCLLTRGEKKKLVTVDLGAIFQGINSLEQEAVIMDKPEKSARALTFRAKVLAYLLRIFVNIGDESEIGALSPALRHYEAAAGLPAYRRAQVSSGLPLDQFFLSARAVAEEYGPKFGITIPKGDFDPSILSEVGNKMMSAISKSGIDIADLQKTLQGGDMTQIMSKATEAAGKINYKECMAELFPTQAGSGEVFDD